MEYIVHLPHSQRRRLRMPGMQLVARRDRPNDRRAASPPHATHSANFDEKVQKPQSVSDSI